MRVITSKEGVEEDDRRRNKKQYMGNYFSNALQGCTLLVYVCCSLNKRAAVLRISFSHKDTKTDNSIPYKLKLKVIISIILQKVRYKRT